MNEELSRNLKALIEGKDRDSALVGIQILLQDIDQDVKEELLFILLKSSYFQDIEFKDDIIELFKQCGQTIIKNRVKKL